MRSYTVPDQTGKYIIITGIRGLAYETARALAKANAILILCTRNMENGNKVVDKLIEESQNKNISCQYLDLCDFQSIKKFASDYISSGNPLHVLINNAGIMALKDRKLTKDGNEMQLQTNYLGHFLLTHLLLPVLRKSEPSRVVMLSSVAHYMPMSSIYFKDMNFNKGYGPWKAYCQSKLACLLFAYEMTRRLRGSQITINAVHPGVVRTSLWDTYHKYSIFKGFLFNLFEKIFMITPEEGARTSLYVATSEACGKKSGGYYANCRKAISYHISSYRSSVQKKLYETSCKMVDVKEIEPVDASQKKTE